jgi:hypothetical protein
MKERLYRRIMRGIWRVLLALILPVLAAGPVYSQDHSLGAIFDGEAYNALQRKAPPAAGSYEGLPKSFSLKQYAPQPGDQADYGTCVAWASAYGARTIAESIALSRKNRDEITRNAFSPAYVYRSIRPDDPECLMGAQIHQALDLMKDSGAVKMLDTERGTNFPLIELSSYRESKKYPIAGYVTLYSREERGKPALVTRTVKKSLVEGKPVIIGMNTPSSFIDAVNVWHPEESPDDFYGGHAMCVVGYDDERNGGAFEVLNSWGRKWGNGGFMWIPYKAFVDFVMESYEMIENLSVFTDTTRFAGSLRLEIASDSGSQYTPVPLTADSPNSPGFYRAAEALQGGTEFRFVAGSRESAYLYVFAASQSPDAGIFYSPVLLFPQTGLSPLVNSGEVILPGSGTNRAVEPGTEYLVVLYAKQPLDIRTIMHRFENARGAAHERLARALGKNLLRRAEYGETDAVLNAETGNNRSVAALVLAIDHRLNSE